MHKIFLQRLNLLFYWAPPLLWMLGILTLSGDLGSSINTSTLLEWLLSSVFGVSRAHIGDINAMLRKIGHFLGYATLYFLWFRAFHGHLGYGRDRSFLWALSLSLGLALADEGHQSFVASRTGTIWDVALDMSGVFLAALISGTLWFRRQPVSVPSPR